MIEVVGEMAGGRCGMECRVLGYALIACARTTPAETGGQNLHRLVKDREKI
jgi:hypothetical protein